MGIISEKVIIKTNPTHNEYYANLGYLDEIKKHKVQNNPSAYPTGIEFEVLVKDLLPNSKAIIVVQCENPKCNKIFEQTMCQYTRSRKFIPIVYCSQCAKTCNWDNIRKKGRLIKDMSAMEWCIKNNKLELLKYYDEEKTGISPEHLPYRTNQKIFAKCPRGLHDSFSIRAHTLFSNNKDYPSCKKCNSVGQYLIDNFTKEEIKLLLPTTPIESLFDEQKSSNKKFLFGCVDVNHPYYEDTMIRSYGRNFRCPRCSYYTGEFAVERFLIANDIKYESQKRFFDFHRKLGKRLSFDFYLPEYNAAIEFQGKQHLYKEHIYHNEENAWEQQKERDDFKNKYAVEHNIVLLHIWFFEAKRIEKILEDFIGSFNRKNEVWEAEKMRFIYAFTEEGKNWMDDNKFKKITTVKINDEDVIIYSNQKDVIIPDDIKYKDLMWSNRLMF